MGERADGLRGVSRQNASGLPMLVGTDPAASAGRVRHTSRRASLFSRNGDDSACLVNITPPLRSSKLTAHRKRRRRPSGPVPNAWRGLSPSVRGLSPWGERTACAVRTGQSIVRSHRLAGVCPHGRVHVLTRLASPRRVWLFPLVSDRIKFSAAICFTSASRRRRFGVGIGSTASSNMEN